MVNDHPRNTGLLSPPMRSDRFVLSTRWLTNRARSSYSRAEWDRFRQFVYLHAHTESTDCASSAPRQAVRGQPMPEWSLDKPCWTLLTPRRYIQYIGSPSRRRGCIARSGPGPGSDPPSTCSLGGGELGRSNWSVRRVHSNSQQRLPTFLPGDGFRSLLGVRPIKTPLGRNALIGIFWRSERPIRLSASI